MSKTKPIYHHDTIYIEDCDPSGVGEHPKVDVLVVSSAPTKAHKFLGTPLERAIVRTVQGYGHSAALVFAQDEAGWYSTDAVIEKRPQLYQQYLQSSPSKVLLLGPAAQMAFLGRVDPADKIRNAYCTSLDGTYFFSLPDPDDVKDNTVLKRWLSEDLSWAMENFPSPTPYNSAYRMVESDEDFTELEREVLTAGQAVVDVESFGRMHTDEYKLVVLSVSVPHMDFSWVFDEEALVPGSARREKLCELLRKVPTSAHNADYEWRGVGSYLGVTITLAVDTKIVQKLRFPDGMADLDHAAAMVGMGGHKAEAKEDLEVKQRILTGLRAARDKQIPTKIDYETRINKNNRKYKVKLVLESRPQTEREKLKSIHDAWVKPRSFDHVKTSYAELVGTDLTEDWVVAAMSDAPHRTYTYGLMNRTLCIRYCATDTISCARLVKMFQQIFFTGDTYKHQRRTYETILRPIVPVVSRMMSHGVLIDMPRLSEFEGFLDERIEIATKAIQEFCPGMNPGSDEQRAAYLFGPKSEGGLALPVLKRTKKAKAPSSAADVLEKFKGAHPSIEHFQQYAKLTKLQSNYARGLRPHILPDNRIHCNLNTTGAASGRWTSSTPNMQTLPRRGEYAKMAKSIYIAPPGYELVALDFSTLEIRVAALLSGDKAMLELLTSKDSSGKALDFHLETAKRISRLVWGNDLEDCGLGYSFLTLKAEYGSTEAAMLDPRWKALTEEIKRRRDIAKTINFALVYGQGDESMADRAGCSVEEAATAREGIFGDFKGLRRWLDDQQKLCRREGGVWTYWNGEKARFRHIPDIGSSDYGTRGHGERVSGNTPVQGSGADYNTVSLIQIDDWIEKTGFDAKILLAVHDSNISEVRSDLVMDYAHNVARMMTSHFSGPVPLLVDAERGSSYGAMEPLVLEAA